MSPETVSDNAIGSDECFEYFQTLFGPPETEANPYDDPLLRNIMQDNNTEVLEQPITEEEIRTSIKNLNGLCIEMFKTTIDIIMPYLLALFNYIYDHGLFPEDWCRSIITPIHKGGAVDKPENQPALCLIN